MFEVSSVAFIKWAGGKNQLIEQLTPLFPKKIDRYFEPFVGSGAVFFHIIQTYHPKEVFLSDMNEELIITYKVIQKNVELLIKKLKVHKLEFQKNQKEYFYLIRKLDSKTLSDEERAARFIFLNRTCFNGLYRENSKGEFNVPIGSYKNPDVVQEDRIRLANKLLKNVKIEKMSFEKTLPQIKKGDFVYLDPPYHPLHATSFTKYSKNDFSEKDQIKLREYFDALTKKGALCMESNSHANFIMREYKNYTIKIVKATRRINSDAKNRGKINEVVILNY